jgi:hypothetical protein
MITRVSGSRVAIRIRRTDDRARRIVQDQRVGEAALEEWRCSQCARWFERGSVTLVESGRAIAGAPEVQAYCASCNTGSRASER